MNCRTVVPAFVLVGGVLLTGCLGAGEPAETLRPAATDSAGIGGDAGGGHNAADTLYAQMMIPHEDLAVDLSDLLIAKGTETDPDVLALARRTKATHFGASGDLKAWLEGWGDPAEPGSADHPVEAMMGGEVRGRLASAEGDGAAQLFLEQLAIHQAGAVQMAKVEIAEGSNAMAVRHAERVAKDEQAGFATTDQLLREHG